MYSPKIKNEDLIRRLYKLKQAGNKKVPMTQMVKEAIEDYLNKHEVKNEKR